MGKTKIPSGSYAVIAGRTVKLSPGQAKYNTALAKKEKPTEDGYIFDSLAELKYYQELKLRKKAGDVKEFKVKPKLWVNVNMENTGKHLEAILWSSFHKETDLHTVRVFTYTPDFVVDGELVDVKGFITPEFKLKARIMAALGMPVKVVK